MRSQLKFLFMCNSSSEDVTRVPILVFDEADYLTIPIFLYLPHLNIDDEDDYESDN